MKISMIDKVLAIGLVLAVYGITLKADHNVNRKVTIDQKDKVEVKASEQEKQKETVDYNQIREEYKWDLEGAVTWARASACGTNPQTKNPQRTTTHYLYQTKETPCSECRKAIRARLNFRRSLPPPPPKEAKLTK